MDSRKFSPNQIRFATEMTHPKAYRDGRWIHYEEPTPKKHTLCGKDVLLRPGLTWTPYANPTPCNAHCAFCSEELLRKDGTHLTAKRTIRDYDLYFAGIDRFLQEISGFRLGLSLSGLEATSEPNWMLRLLCLLQKHEHVFAEKVLYTNGSGLYTDERLIEGLRETGFDRIELSRCSFDTQKNQSIMRFARNEPVWTTEAFLSLLRKLTPVLHVKLSCILCKTGTSSITEIEEYIFIAKEHGIQEIVFRELSQLGDSYIENRFLTWIEDHRVSVLDCMEAMYSETGTLRKGWKFVGATCGYYYYNEIYEFAGLRIILENSSYIAHEQAQQTGVFHKLVFHSNGDLCGDWVPNSNVIGNYCS